MSAVSRIDVRQNDRGLQTCFDAANVQSTWAATFCKLHKLETLDDFVYLMDSKDWEQNLKDLLNASSDLKDNRLILARFKAAYESGVSAIKASQARRTSPVGMVWSWTPIWTQVIAYAAVSTKSSAARL